MSEPVTDATGRAPAGGDGKPSVRDAELSIFVAKGELASADVLAAYQDFLKRGPTRLVLWDLTSATVCRVPADDVRTLARQIASMAMEHTYPNHGKTAIVCGHSLTFATTRMLGTFLETEGFPRRVAVFRDMKTAKAWLTDDPAEP
jgi:hypothetical protein